MNLWEKGTGENTLCISVGSDKSLFGVTNDGRFWGYEDSRWMLKAGSNFKKVATQDSKNVWGVTCDGNFYHFDGVAWSQCAGQQVLDISVGFDGTIYGVSSDGSFWKYENNVWTLKEGIGDGKKLLKIAVHRENEVLCVEHDGGFYRYDGNSWVVMPGNSGKDISIAHDRSIFGVSKNGTFWKYDNDSWHQLAGNNVLTISAYDANLVWGVDGEGYERIFNVGKLAGFRGSDWDNNENSPSLYAALGLKIYKSIDKGNSFKEWAVCPVIPNVNSLFGSIFSVMIPTPRKDEHGVRIEANDMMLVSPMGSNTLYQCFNINAVPPELIPVIVNNYIVNGDLRPKDGGVCLGITEDRAGNLYAGWYALEPGPMAKLYKCDAVDRHLKTSPWREIESWKTRHIHNVKVNPHNDWIYVVLGEPNASSNASPDAAMIMRSKDGGENWTCVTDTWKSVPTGPEENKYGLYFMAMSFLRNRVIIGEDTNFVNGRIYYFDDDGRTGSNAPPFLPTLCYTAENPGEYWMGAVTVNDRVFFGSQADVGGYGGSKNKLTVHCVSTRDFIDWTEHSSAEVDSSNNLDCNLGQFTYHPDRGNGFLYSLSGAHTYFVDNPERPLTEREIERLEKLNLM